MKTWFSRFLCRVGVHNFIKIRKEKIVGDHLINEVGVGCVKTISYELECNHCGFKKPVTENFYGDIMVRKEIIVNNIYSDRELNFGGNTSLTVNNHAIINN